MQDNAAPITFTKEDDIMWKFMPVQTRFLLSPVCRGGNRNLKLNSGGVWLHATRAGKKVLKSP